jgi:hypothetical protein
MPKEKKIEYVKVYEGQVRLGGQGRLHQPGSFDRETWRDLHERHLRFTSTASDLRSRPGLFEEQ